MIDPGGTGADENGAADGPRIQSGVTESINRVWVTRSVGSSGWREMVGALKGVTERVGSSRVAGGGQVAELGNAPWRSEPKVSRT